LGTVKSRLAASIGASEALAAYNLLVHRILATLAPLSGVELCFTPDDAADQLRGWLHPGWQLRPQGTGDLGARMNAAFTHAFDAGADRAVLIGSDCPGITVDDIEQAWEVLGDSDVVLGPARDGGYWLVGLRRAQPDLFHAMRWSTNTVFRETLARARTARLRVRLARELVDVDTEEDWWEYLRVNTPQNQGFD
jgi:uncharacterized protein